MKFIKDYQAPNAHDLVTLKNQLGYTGAQMADLAGVAGDSQWRKYTRRENPRTINPHILFFMAAQLVLNNTEIQKVIEKMDAIGAKINRF
ncbi:XRE family transcriptional regulator [Serratia marcescens]|uniref:XRE family transcriptional regulator n=1 Tax=Serratia marcescens TaxID=615 RepID=UPI0032047AAB